MNVAIPVWLGVILALIALVCFIAAMIKVKRDIDYCMGAYFRQQTEKDARFKRMERELFEMRQREIVKGHKP